MKRIAPILVTLALMLPGPSHAVDPVVELQDGDVYASTGSDGVVLGNAFVERRWQADALVTTALVDKRPGGVSIAEPHADFSLIIDAIRVGSDRMSITDVTLSKLDRGGVRVRFSLSLAGIVGLTRTVEAYPRVAGLSSRTSVTPLVPVVVSGYTLDEIAVGSAVAPTVHAFRAGADWRDPEWKPSVAVGDPHTGDWRVSETAASGAPLSAPGQWLTLARADGHSAFMVMERHNYASSRMAYDGGVGSAVVDLSRDIIYIGPFEEQAHVENPGPGPARHRVLLPGTETALERVFTGLGADPDDEPWQFSKYLTGHRLTPYQKAVTYNTNGVDSNVISTGAKDDVDYNRFLSLAAAAREIGVETFIFDDGWQAISGDWCADSAECPEPRAPRYPPRFPDDHFGQVGEDLKGDPADPSDDMTLGLWMNPMEFHPAAAAFKANPQWACIPTGLATAALNLAQPDDGSNEAGIGVWNPAAIGRHPDTGEVTTLIDYIEGRIRRQIEVFGARYFKFDFLVWIDCLGVAPVDMYAYHDSFLAMLDRLQSDHPEVTYQIDETNDYRMFPFESVARGPSWFQNGAPEASRMLHNLWSLAPYVPGYSIGQKALDNRAEVAARGVDYLMAVTLPSHITFMTEIDEAFTPAQRAQIRRWTDFYKANRNDLATFTYPLLADPIAKGWTALQPWNADTGRGFLLAFRQEAANETRRIPLRGVPSTGTFELTRVDPATNSELSLGTVDASALRSGIDVTLPLYGYAIFRIAPAS